MRHIDPDPSPRTLLWLRRSTVAVLTVVMGLVIYFLGVAPAFIVALKSEESVTFHVRRAYRPLFKVAPNLTSNYLQLCGFSDVEIFFVLTPQKGDTR